MSHFNCFCNSQFINFHLQAVVDSVFFGSCLTISAHFDIIRTSLHEDIKKFVEKHQVLLELVKDLNKIYKPVIFVQFLTSSVHFCVVGFQLLITTSYIDRTIVGFHIFTTVFEILIFAYCGQLLLDKSLKVADDFYHVDKNIMIICTRALKGCIIKSGFYKVTLIDISAIFSAAYSLLTVLKTLKDKI